MIPEIFQRLVSFNAKRKFRAAAYASIISNKLMLKAKQLRRILGGFETLSPQDLKKLHENFQKMFAQTLKPRIPSSFTQVD